MLTGLHLTFCFVSAKSGSAKSSGLSVQSPLNIPLVPPMSSGKLTSPFRVNSVAPIRICDNGGWTDTWFAGHGRIFNIGVYPYVEVQLAVYPAGEREHRIVINAENYGERYALPEGGRSATGEWIRHPLLEAAIEYMHIPKDLAFEATIYSEAPTGMSTGTSAAVSVALIGALDCLTPGRMTAHEVALAAQKIETEMLGQQCGNSGSALLGVWRDQLYRDASLPLCFGLAHPRIQRNLVGAGAAAGAGLPGQLAQFVPGA